MREASTEPVAQVLIPGREFMMGSDGHYPEEAPAHRVRVGDVLMDRTPVTNRQFLRFVERTGYRTDAERAPSQIGRASCRERV